MPARTPRQGADQSMAAFGFVTTDRRGDAIHIEIMRSTNAAPDPVQLVDDRVTALHTNPLRAIPRVYR